LRELIDENLVQASEKLYTYFYEGEAYPDQEIFYTLTLGSTMFANPLITWLGITYAFHVYCLKLIS
jgi:hypothetical protein